MKLSNNTDKSYVQGIESTKDIAAHITKVGKRSLGYPDAGACSLVLIFTDITEHIK